MPVTLDELSSFATTALTDAEKLYVRQVLREESTVAVPSDTDVTDAFTALAAAADTAARVQHLRAQLARYRAGQVRIDGGQDALTYDVFLERWGVRNAVRLLLGFSAEPRPATSNSLQLFELPLGSFAPWGSEFS